LRKKSEQRNTKGEKELKCEKKSREREREGSKKQNKE